MKILVTGGTGFLGKALALKLRELGFEVTAIGRNQTIGTFLEAHGIQFMNADLTCTEQIQAACKEQNIVFHCGALSSPWGAYRDFHNANVIGTQNIIESCQRHQVSLLVHISTPSIYFDYQHRFNIPEDMSLPTQACNHYAKSKRLAETLVDQAFKDGLPTITIRPRGIFGPGDTSLIPRIIRANRSGGIPLIDQGSALVDITYIDNLTDALIACLTAPSQAYGRHFNITNGQPIILKEVLTQLFSLLDEPPRFRLMSYQQANRLASTLEIASRLLTWGKIEPLLTRYTVGVLGKSQTLDISAAKALLGYQPRISIEEGLRQFSGWWKEQVA